MDTVYVNGKKVGTISVNLDDMDGGINYSSVDGSFSKELNSIQELIAFLEQRYGKQAA